MNEEDLERFRMNMRYEVLLVLVRGIYTGLANASPTASASFRDQFQKLRKEHSQIALRTKEPAQSDMLAAEYQEALEDALSFIEAGFKS